MVNLYEELGESSRRGILLELRSGPKKVSDVVNSTGLKQPNVSNHLARMRIRGVVTASKVGREVFYALATPEIAAAVQNVFSVKAGTPGDIDLHTRSLDYAKAAVEGDDATCAQILDECFRASLPMLVIYEELFGAAMKLVGDWYAVRAVDEGQEHMATAITERLMSRVVQVAPPMMKIGKIAILGNAEGARHTVALRMLSDYLRTRGWRTYFLGPDVPRAAFLNSVKVHKPDLILLNCNSEESLSSTIGLIKDLKVSNRRKPKYSIVVGGSTVHSHGDEFVTSGADFVSTSLSGFVNSVLLTLEADVPGKPKSSGVISEN